MTSREVKKFQKRKKREKKAKAKVRHKREFKRKLDKEKKELEKNLDTEASLFNKQKPYMKPETIKALEEQNRKSDEEIIAQIEHNLKILEAMEEEYLKEQLAREELNQELEDQGLETVEEKIEYLKQKAQKDAEEMEKKLGLQ